MDIFDLLFGWGGQAMQLTFQYGFILKEEDFLELTDEQYVQFHIKMGECNEKVFLIAPADPRNAIEADSTELPRFCISISLLRCRSVAHGRKSFSSLS